VTLLKISRISLLIPASLVFLLAGLGVNLFFSGSDRRRARANAISTMLWARAMCSILGICVVKRGVVMGKGCFTVCNHMSYLDVFAVGSIRPSAFLSNHEVKGWPVVGWLASLGGTVFVNRKSKRAALDAMREIEQKIDAGIAVVMFPEGTTSDGRSVKAFKSTFFRVPASRKIPVAPVSIRYALDMQDELVWHGGMKLAPHFWKIIGFRRIVASLYFSQPVSESADAFSSAELRKRLCARAYESVVVGFNACGTMRR
jgi:1-acyl-sn-glycerol-3-phosphate acyltransferase